MFDSNEGGACMYFQFCPRAFESVAFCNTVQQRGCSANEKIPNHSVRFHDRLSTQSKIPLAKLGVE